MAQPEPAEGAVQRYPLHAYILGHPEARERFGPSLSEAFASGRLGPAHFPGPLQFSAMHAAALADDAEAVALLAAAGCPLNDSSARSCDRAIMLAATPGLKPDSRLLAHDAFRQAADLWVLLQPALAPELQGAFQAGSLVDGDCSQATPLCVAVRMQHVAAAGALLQLGAQPDQRMPVDYKQDYDADGCNVTLLAAVAGCGRLVPYLPRGVTPRRQRLAQLLLAHGADPCAAPNDIAMSTPIGLAAAAKLLESSAEQDPPLGWTNEAADLLFEAAPAGKATVVTRLLRKLGQRFADEHVMHFAKVQAAAAGREAALRALTGWDPTRTTWLQQQLCQAQVLNHAVDTCCLAGVRLVLRCRFARTLARDWLVYRAPRVEARMQLAGGAAWATHPVTRLVQVAAAAQARHASSAAQELTPQEAEADVVGIAEELRAAGFLVDNAFQLKFLPRNHPVRVALEQPAWAPEQHSRFPSCFRQAAGALLLAHARLRRNGTTAGGGCPTDGGASLGDLPAELLPLVVGHAAYPISAWMAGGS